MAAPETHDGRPVIWHHASRPEDRKTPFDAIAEEYLVIDEPAAQSGIVVYAKYRGEWAANPFSTRALTVRLLETIKELRMDSRRHEIEMRPQPPSDHDIAVVLSSPPWCWNADKIARALQDRWFVDNVVLVEALRSNLADKFDAAIPPWKPRPIATAPKDGTKILAIRPSRGDVDFDVATAWWQEAHDVWPDAGWGGHGWRYADVQPTHWLPHPPEPRE
jgi:hypothetical protein